MVLCIREAVKSPLLAKVNDAIGQNTEFPWGRPWHTACKV